MSTVNPNSFWLYNENWDKPSLEGKVESPLIKATEEGDLDAVTALIHSGANVDIQDEYGRTPLMLALGRHQFSIARALLDLNDEINDIEDSFGSAPLMFAAQAGDLELFEKVLAKDQKINKTNKEGMTALAYAALGGHLKICERLIELGAEVDLGQTSDGDTALMCAVNEGYHEIVKKLIDKGAAVNAMNKSKETPLIRAIIRRNPEMVSILLENGANVNASVQGVNSLMLTMLLGSFELAKILIKGGADLNHISEDGETILDFIKRNRFSNYREMRDLIITRDSGLKARNKELKNCKHLGHAWHLSGHFFLNKKNEEVGFGHIPLTGASSCQWFHQMKKNLPQFELRYPGRLEDLNAFEDALDFGASQESFSDEEILQRIKDGLPTLIDTGFLEHTAIFLIWGDQLLVCNRGGVSRRPLASYHFDQNTFTLELVNKIRKTTKNGPNKGYIQLLTILDEICFQTEQDSELQNALVLQNQTVGNCSWVSAITAVYGMLLLAGVRDANEEERASRLQKQVDLYRTWIGFQQIASIEQMMRLIPEGVSPYLPDHNLIQKALKSAHLTAWDEILNAKLDAATEIYVQSLSDAERDAFLVNLEAWKAERLINPKQIVL